MVLGQQKLQKSWKKVFLLYQILFDCLPDAAKDAPVAGVITEGQRKALPPFGEQHKLMLDVFKTVLR